MRGILLFSILLLSALRAFSDGKMYAETVNTEIPYQRAFIVHNEGMQSMMLQSQYAIPGKAGDYQLGWVVPVPSVPEIESMDADRADRMFRDLSFSTKPDRISLSDWLALGLFALSIISFFPMLNWVFFRSCRRRNFFLWSAILFAGSSTMLLVMLFITGRHWKGTERVEVVDSGRAGIYETKIIKSRSVDGLLEWFRSESFRFDETDRAAIQSYIDRGWCFVTTRVDALVSMEDSSTVSSNLLAPLILHFPAEHPVYPTALTATGGHPTEILIYLFSGDFPHYTRKIEVN